MTPWPAASYFSPKEYSLSTKAWSSWELELRLLTSALTSSLEPSSVFQLRFRKQCSATMKRWSLRSKGLFEMSSKSKDYWHSLRKGGEEIIAIRAEEIQLNQPISGYQMDLLLLLLTYSLRNSDKGLKMRYRAKKVMSLRRLRRIELMDIFLRAKKVINFRIQMLCPINFRLQYHSQKKKKKSSQTPPSSKSKIQKEKPNVLLYPMLCLRHSSKKLEKVLRTWLLSR